MKVIIELVAFGALWIVLGSTFAHSQEPVVERKAEAGPGSVNPLDDVPIPSNQDVLPDAPQVADVPQTQKTGSGGLWTQVGMLPGTGRGPMVPQTLHEKWMSYVVRTYGPRALIVPAIPAAIRMANPPSKYPDAWQSGWGGFGRNYGDHLATAGSTETARFVFGAALHEDMRYQRSTSRSFAVRAGHALASTLVDRSDVGHARLAVANLAGVAAGSYVGMSYLPEGFNDVTHADQRLAVRVGGLVGGNLGTEFGPDIFRFLMEHHVRIPQIPIPVWWTRLDEDF